MRDLSLLVDYLAGKYTPEDFRDILLADEDLCDYIRVTYATKITRRDVDIISVMAKSYMRGGTLDEVAAKILDCSGVEYKRKRTPTDDKTLTKQMHKKLAEDYAEKNKAEFLSSLPMPPETFKKLFNYLDKRLRGRGCDHTLDITTEFLNRRKLPAESVTDWLLENGGGCDCEVLFNIEELFDEYGC